MTDYHPFWESVYVRNYISLGALIWLVVESSITFPFELAYIWRARWTVVKALYLSIRYTALFGQTANHIWASKLLASPPVQQRDCRRWFAYQAALVQCLIYFIEAIVMLRVYALFNRSKKIGIFLGCVWMVEMLTMTICAVRVNRGFTFDPTCLLVHIPFEIAISGAVFVVAQTITYAMIVHQRTARNAQLRRHPLTGLLTRDGAVVILFLFAFHAAAIPYTLLVQQLPHSTFPLFLALLSFIGCRMIQNVKTIKPAGETPSNTALSTIVSIIGDEEFETSDES